MTRDKYFALAEEDFARRTREHILRHLSRGEYKEAADHTRQYCSYYDSALWWTDHEEDS